MIVLFPLLANSQSDMGLRETLGLLQNGGINGYLTGGGGLVNKELPPVDYEGDIYLNSEWEKAILIIQGGKEYNVYLKYDMHNKFIIAKSESTVWSIPAKHVEEFILIDSDRRFVNGINYSFLDSPINGFMEVISSGKLTLLGFTKLHIREPTYQPAKDIGNKNYVLTKVEEMYITKGKVLVKMIKPNKQNFRWFDDNKEVIKYIKKEKKQLYFKDDVLEVIKLYNEKND